MQHVHPAIVYYYFGHAGVAKIVRKNLRLPVYLAMASLRAFHPALPIYVIDASDEDMDWEDYPEVLKFKLITMRPVVDEIMRQASKAEGLRYFTKLLAKPMAIREAMKEIAQPLIVFVDADLFWVTQMTPLLADFNRKFCAGDNTGMFYFDKRLPLSQKVMDLWTAYCTHICFDSDFCARVMQRTGSTAVHEETVMQYMRQEFPDWFDAPPLSENCPFMRYGEPVQNNRAFKTIHCHSNNFAMAERRKGLACLWIKELRENVTRVLGLDRMEAIFGDLESPCYSLYDVGRMGRMNRETDFEALKK